MAYYNPPTEYITEFNTTLFNNDLITGGGTGDLTKAQADTYYLSKTTTDTSTASITTFNNQVVVKGDTDVGSPSTSSGWFNNRFRMRIFDISSPNTNFTQLYMINNNEFVIGPNTIGDKISLYIKDSGGNQIQRVEVTDATTKINNPLVITEGSTPSSTVSQSGNNTLINNDNNSGKIIFNARSSGGTPLDVMSLEQTQIVNNVPVIYKANAIQYTEGKQLAQIFQINNKSVSGSINFSTQTSGGIDTTCATINTSGFTIPTGVIFYVRTIRSIAATSNHSLFDNLGAGSTLAIASASCATTFNGITTYPLEQKYTTRITHKLTQYLNEVLTVAGTTTTLTFPLQQTIMLTSTGASIAITLPTITASTQCGFTFIFTKTASITNSVILTAGGANSIIPYGSITNASPYTTMVAGETCFHLITLEISSGVFAWREI